MPWTIYKQMSIENCNYSYANDCTKFENRGSFYPLLNTAALSRSRRAFCLCLMPRTLWWKRLRESVHPYGTSFRRWTGTGFVRLLCCSSCLPLSVDGATNDALSSIRGRSGVLLVSWLPGQLDASSRSINFCFKFTDCSFCSSICNFLRLSIVSRVWNVIFGISGALALLQLSSEQLAKEDLKVLPSGTGIPLALSLELGRSVLPLLLASCFCGTVLRGCNLFSSWAILCMLGLSVCMVPAVRKNTLLVKDPGFCKKKKHQCIIDQQQAIITVKIICRITGNNLKYINTG